MDSSEISTSIKNAVHHLKQLGKYDIMSEYFLNMFVFVNKGGSFQTNTFTETDLNNIDSVADTLMTLVKEMIC